MSEPIVEIRTPTYRRPRLLRRALESLLAQSWPHWRCRVIDDDPTGNDAQAVCEALADPRIRHERNAVNLKVGANIDRAFSLPGLTGSTHAAVLEDDNYYLPDCLAANLRTMTEHGVDIVLRNQWIENPPGRFEDGVVGPRTTYDNQYSEGLATHAELWGTLFTSTAANNSSLFWRLGRGLDFSTLAMTADPVFQERLRTLCIERPVYIAMTPLIVWRDNGAESTRPSATGWHWRIGQVRSAARERRLYRMLYAHLAERGLDRHVWHSRFRRLDSHGERVFRRTGIRPAVASTLPWRDRLSLAAKREIARLASLLAHEPVNYRLGASRIEAVPARDR